MSSATPVTRRMSLPSRIIEPCLAGPFRFDSWRDGPSGEVVSSSRIRTLVRDGDLTQAEAFLGHPFRVLGPIVEGDRRGRSMGAPTLNLIWPADQVAPPYGVYAGRAGLAAEKPVPAVANFGIRPTFGGGDPRLEVHLLEDITGDHYGDQVRFELLHHLREERRFESPQALQAQIRRDVETARRLLADRL